MKTRSFWTIGLAAGLILLMLAPFVLTAQEKPNIAFKWAFGALVGKSKAMVPITRDTTLKSGEEIKMLVQLSSDCFVYVLHYGPDGELELLFPSSIRQFQTDYKQDKNYYVPAGRAWSQLDKTTGREVFFIVASSERLLDLEAKIGAYLSAEESKKGELGKALVSDVRELRRRFNTYSTLAEKPLTIGGNIRGKETEPKTRRPDVADILTEISARNFYSKTITIDHQ